MLQWLKMGGGGFLPSAIMCRKEMKWWRTEGVSSSARPKSRRMSCSCPLTSSADCVSDKVFSSVRLTKMLPGCRSLQQIGNSGWVVRVGGGRGLRVDGIVSEQHPEVDVQ